MFDKLETVGTQAAQVWLDADLATLGWTRGPILMSAYKEPLETWADMTNTLPSERRWLPSPPAASTYPPARSAIYFCGVLPQEKVKETEAEARKELPQAADGSRALRELADKKLRSLVEENLKQMLESGMKPFWPRAYDDKGRTPVGRLIGGLTNQHVQANALGSARYTLALPGTSRFRISPLDRSVVNMTIAGDWTECGFNEGCVEAAVMSGMLAAYAISGRPAPEAIVGYDHP